MKFSVRFNSYRIVIDGQDRVFLSLPLKSQTCQFFLDYEICLFQVSRTNTSLLRIKVLQGKWLCQYFLDSL